MNKSMNYTVAHLNGSVRICLNRYIVEETCKTLKCNDGDIATYFTN